MKRRFPLALLDRSACPFASDQSIRVKRRVRRSDDQITRRNGEQKLRQSRSLLNIVPIENFTQPLFIAMQRQNDRTVHRNEQDEWHKEHHDTIDDVHVFVEGHVSSPSEASTMDDANGARHVQIDRRCQNTDANRHIPRATPRQQLIDTKRTTYSEETLSHERHGVIPIDEMTNVTQIERRLTDDGSVKNIDAST
jgi:hypothetical protein